MSRSGISSKSTAKLIVTSLLLIGVGTIIIMLGFHMSQPVVATSCQMGLDTKVMEALEHLEAQFQKQGVMKESVPVQREKPAQRSERCEVVIVGMGVGGLVSAYRLAPLLGKKLCLFDEREKVGGKSQSIRFSGQGQSERPVWLTAQPDLLRGGDSILRCLAHEFGSPIITHGSLGTFFLGETFSPEWLFMLMRNQSFPKESFGSYLGRVLGQENATQFRDSWGMGHMEKYDARWMLDFLQQDSQQQKGHLREFHNGAQVGLFERVLRRVVENKAQLFLSSRVSSIQENSNGYELLVNDSIRIEAKKVVLAVPLGHFGEMNGNVMEILRSSKFYQQSEPVKKCRWSATFSEKWWTSLKGFSCNTGYCIDYPVEGKEMVNFLHTSNPFTTGLSTIQYKATPEGREGNVLVYEWEEDACKEVSLVYKETGLIGLKNQVMTRTKLLLNISIKDPLHSYYSAEANGGGLLPGADFTGKEMEKWASQPLGKESLCIATGSVVVDDFGWMESGAKAAHNCLKANFHTDLSRSEKCSHRGKTLSRESGRDNCLLLKGEFHQRDLANLSYCGGANHFPYPTLSTLTDPIPEDRLRIPVPIPIYEPIPYYGNRFLS